MPTTCIRNAAWVVAWDAAGGRHVYRRDADVAFAENTISFVGQGYAGPTETEVDGRDLLVLPGLVDIHSHPNSESSYRGLREEHGVPNMHMTGLYERAQAFSPVDDEARRAGAEVSYCELLLSGVTTLADLSAPYEGWADLVGRSGLRGFLAPGYASARWRLENDSELKYDWDEKRGRAGFDEALRLIDQLGRHPSGRLSGIVFPAQIDTCSADLLRDSADAARERRLPLTTHAAQSVAEFREMVRRHGKTPIQWARDIGMLGPNTILGHALFIDSHSWINWWTRRDVKDLAETGTSVAHCPSPFARYGQILENFGDYVRGGVNMGLGTDTTPHNLVEEMRKAAVLARVAARDINTVSTAMLFHAATVGGARALLRDDIGRLAPGCKADIVLVDLANPWMMPARDPLRSFIYHAADRAVRDVYVDGRKVVENHKVLMLDHADAAARLTEAQQRMMAAARQRDYKGRTADEISPLSLSLASAEGPTGIGGDA